MGKMNTKYFIIFGYNNNIEPPLIKKQIMFIYITRKISDKVVRNTDVDLLLQSMTLNSSYQVCFDTSH